jgi:thiol-disulfide isomerase/thioredoxin
MKFSILVTLVLLSFFSCTSNEQPIAVVKFDAVKKILANDTDKVRVINFWATWCAPCIKELPNFEALGEKYDQIEVILINLDFVEGLDKVKKFSDKRALKSKVILLDEIDYNSWIDQVSTDWSGAIPATIIVGPHAASKKFIEGELSASELEEALQLII